MEILEDEKERKIQEGINLILFHTSPVVSDRAQISSGPSEKVISFLEFRPINKVNKGYCDGFLEASVLPVMLINIYMDVRVLCGGRGIAKITFKTGLDLTLKL
ncbi:hypothetical protein VNO77_17217 [Canavalia gladiata]|uniref:Uncharacterized protein n=1 Tax=Canavalia gladiata TaxID=3824 RepID=A0AAN9LJA9_CANGL